MIDIFSLHLPLSVFQLFSIISFLTSCVALLCLNISHLPHLPYSNKTSMHPEQPVSPVESSTKQVWSWSLSGLPIVSLNMIIGDDEEYRTPGVGEDVGIGSLGLTGGMEGGFAHQVVKMNWPSTKPVVNSPPPPPRSISPPKRITAQRSAPSGPASMAKLIMSRHSHRKGRRISQSSPGMLKPTPTPLSRFVHSAPEPAPSISI